MAGSIPLFRLIVWKVSIEPDDTVEIYLNKLYLRATVDDGVTSLVTNIQSRLLGAEISNIF